MDTFLGEEVEEVEEVHLNRRMPRIPWMAWDREWRHEVGDSTSWSHELYTLHVCWSAGFGNYNVDRKGICTAYKGISIHSQD